MRLCGHATLGSAHSLWENGHAVNEDPVTASAHCCLAEYWGEKLGKTEMTAYQASARGGVVKVARRGDRVALIGRAVTVSRGEWLVTPS